MYCVGAYNDEGCSVGRCSQMLCLTSARARAHTNTHRRAHTQAFLTPRIQNIICLLTHECNHNSLSGFLVWLPTFHSLSLVQYKPSCLHLSPALFIFQALWKWVLFFFKSIIQGKFKNSGQFKMFSDGIFHALHCGSLYVCSQFKSIFIHSVLHFIESQKISLNDDWRCRPKTSSISSYLNTHGAVSKELLQIAKCWRKILFSAISLSLSSDNVEHQAKTITCKCISSVKVVLLMSADSNIDNSKS